MRKGASKPACALERRVDSSRSVKCGPRIYECWSTLMRRLPHKPGNRTNQARRLPVYLPARRRPGPRVLPAWPRLHRPRSEIAEALRRSGLNRSRSMARAWFATRTASRTSICFRPLGRLGSRRAFLYAFDLLEMDGTDLRPDAWHVRRRR